MFVCEVVGARDKNNKCCEWQIYRDSLVIRLDNATLNQIVSVNVIDTSSVPGSLFKGVLPCQYEKYFRILTGFMSLKDFMNSLSSDGYQSNLLLNWKSLDFIIKPMNLMRFHLILEAEKLLGKI